MRIAVFGKLHSGKGTLCNLLTDAYPDALTFSFAFPVRADIAYMLNTQLDYYKEIFGNDYLEFTHQEITIELINQYKDEVFRPMLQWYGTDFWRDFMGMPRHWIALMRKQLKTYKDTDHILVDDLRFLNEGYALQEEGFTLVRVDRNEEERVASVRANIERNVRIAFAELDETDIQEKIRTKLHAALNHPSELQVDLIPADVIVKNTSLDDMHTVVKYFV